jgi:hypothetical protein
MEKAKKPKASEKLKALEVQVMNTARRTGEMELVIYNLSRENEILKDALQLLHDKQEAVIGLLKEGKELSGENINGKVTEAKEAALKERVDALVDDGQVESVDEVGENSLVVSRELNEKGEVENPRLQFLTARLNEQLRGKFTGKKVGDLIKNDGDTLDIEIMEIYNFVEQELDGGLTPEKVEEAAVASADNHGPPSEGSVDLSTLPETTE